MHDVLFEAGLLYKFAMSSIFLPSSILIFAVRSVKINFQACIGSLTLKYDLKYTFNETFVHYFEVKVLKPRSFYIL